jgi:hypothetical protein
MEQNRSSVQLLAVSLTLGLATFAAVEDDLPSWFGYIPLTLSAALALWAAALLIGSLVLGEAKYVMLEAAARELVPKLPSETRHKYGGMLSPTGTLTAKIFANLISQLDAHARPALFGRADVGMKLEEIPNGDFEGMHEVVEGKLRQIGDGKVPWIDLHMRKSDRAALLRYFTDGGEAPSPPNTGGPRIGRVGRR